MTPPTTGALVIEEHCQRTLDLVSAMVRVWTPTTGVLYVNRAWRDLTGASVEDSAGDGWLRCVHADDRAMLAQAGTASPEGATTRYRVVTREGAPLEVTDVSSAWTSDHGLVLGAIHTLTVQPVSTSSPAVMSRWAHELRGPLNAILGWADLLGSGDNAAEVVARGLKAIATNARQQAQIIKRMTE